MIVSPFHLKKSSVLNRVLSRTGRHQNRRALHTLLQNVDDADQPKNNKIILNIMLTKLSAVGNCKIHGPHK